MLRYKTLGALAITLGAPALAVSMNKSAEPDGQRFEYTAELKAHGLIHLSGIVRDSGERFDLDVHKDGHVDGRFGDDAVEFDIAKKLRDKVAADLGEGGDAADATLEK